MAPTLTPLRDASLDELMAAASPPEVWELMPWPLGRDREAMEAYLATAFADEDAETAIPFAVRLEGKLVGSTRYHAIDRAHRKAEIGYTWYHPSHWRTGLNRAVKISMLDRGFGEMGLHRIYFQIDKRNERSQRAVAALGAVREAELREDRILQDGYLRTTVVYGLLAREWPENRERLMTRWEFLTK
ncbi:N-acetyltransferase [bacterium]|nr:MAG: N-acetyltransferase [bacterium]